jgi:hypothetical protein
VSDIRQPTGSAELLSLVTVEAGCSVSHKPDHLQRRKEATCP